MATGMFQEDNIVVTQKLAMGGDMLNEDNVGLTQDVLDMESLAGLNQSVTVFAASGNESCWSQDSTASMMEIDSRQNHGQMGEAGHPLPGQKVQLGLLFSEILRSAQPLPCTSRVGRWRCQGLG